jgi:hypothetical protein
MLLVLSLKCSSTIPRETNQIAKITDSNKCSSRSDCDDFPKSLQAGCYGRFDWFMGADNPSILFTQIEYPAAITANTGCIRAVNGNALATLSINGSLKYSSIA